MTKQLFKTNEELFKFAQSLGRMLQQVGFNSEANELLEVTGTAWTTASEALGELRVSLLAVRAQVKANLVADYLESLDAAIEQIDDAFARANNPD